MLSRSSHSALICLDFFISLCIIGFPKKVSELSDMYTT